MKAELKTNKLLKTYVKSQAETKEIWRNSGRTKDF